MVDIINTPKSFDANSSSKRSGSLDFGSAQEPKHALSFSQRVLDKREKIFGVGVFVIVVLIVFLVFNYVGLTGKVVFEGRTTYSAGELISGKLNVGLKAGELIPVGSEVVVRLGGQEKILLLSELVGGSPTSGDFYAEDKLLEGTGSGYGVKGEIVKYPVVGFDLMVFDIGGSGSGGSDSGDGVDRGDIIEEPEERIDNNEEVIIEEPENGGGQVEDVITVPDIGEDIVVEEPVEGDIVGDVIRDDSEEQENVEDNENNLVDDSKDLINNIDKEKSQDVTGMVTNFPPQGYDNNKDNKYINVPIDNNDVGDGAVAGMVSALPDEQFSLPKGSSGSIPGRTASTIDVDDSKVGIVRTITGAITGFVVSGLEEIETPYVIAGEIVKGSVFVEEVEIGRSAKIVSGTVVVNGEDVGDDKVSLEIVGNKAEVRTDYVLERNGFGEEFLGEGDGMNLGVNLGEFGMIAENGLLEVELVYEGERIAGFSERIVVSGGDGKEIESFGRPIWPTASVGRTNTATYLGGYEVVRKDGNESLYDVNMTEEWVLVSNVTNNETNISTETWRRDWEICVEANFTEINYSFWADEEVSGLFESEKEKDKVLKEKWAVYEVPNEMTFRVWGLNKTVNDTRTHVKQKELRKAEKNKKAKGVMEVFEEGDVNVFCYHGNISEDYYILFGESSIEIEQTYTLSTDLNLSKVTAEPIYTHLTVNDSDVVGYWSFDMDNATDVYDLTDNGNDGTLVGNANVTETGVIGEALGLDGTGDYVSVANSPSLNFGNRSFAMSAWVNPSSDVTDYRHIIFKANTGGGFEGYYMRIDITTGYALCGIDGIASLEITDSTNHAGGGWVHIMCVTDRTNSTNGHKLYVNGVEKNSGSSVSGNIDNTNSLYIGIFRDANLYPFLGDIDEVLILNRSLTSAEVTDLYEKQYPLFETTGTQHYKSFNQTLSAGENLVNVTTTGYEANNATNVSLSVGYWQVEDGYDDSDADLVGSWHLDNESSLGENSTKVFDSSIGNKNNGTVTGATVSDSGKYDGGFSFDGINDYVDLGSDSSLSSEEGTICSWVNPAESLPEANDHTIFGKYAANADRLVILFDGLNDGLSLFIDSSYVATFSSGDGYFTANTWYHTCIAVGSGGTDIYVNGVNKQHAANTLWTNDISSSNQELGATEYGGVGTYVSLFNGTMDEVKFYNRSLSANEIKELYTIGKLKYNYAADQDLNGENQFSINTSANTFVARYGLNSNSYASYSPYLSDTSIQFTFRNTSESLTTAPNVTFQGQTPANGTIDTSTNKSFIINISVVDDNLDVLTYNWNGTNYTLFNDNLVLMMNFENRSALGENGTLVSDLSGYDNDGVASGGAVINLTNGKYGGGVYFDGSDDYLAVDSVVADVSSDQTGTWSAWVKLPDATPAAVSGIFSISDASDASQEYVSLQVNTNGAIRVDSKKSSSVRWTLNTDVPAFSDNVWTHIVLLHDGTEAHVYVNGIDVAQTFSTSTDKTVWLGDLVDLDVATYGAIKVAGGTEIYLTGSIDEARVFDRALSEAEVNFLYRSNLQWFNDTDAEWWINQTNVNGTALLDANYTYSASGKDSDYPDANETWTGLRSIELTTPSSWTVAGVVVDDTGAAVSGATVYVISQSDSTLAANLTTNSTGGFSTIVYEAGNYTISGFDPANTGRSPDIVSHVIVGAWIGFVKLVGGFGEEIIRGSNYVVSRTFSEFLVLEHVQDAREVIMHLDINQAGLGVIGLGLGDYAGIGVFGKVLYDNVNGLDMGWLSLQEEVL